MTKHFCDRCGKEAKEAKNITVFEPHICTNTDGHRFLTDNDYCLWDECLLKVVGWIEKNGQL